MRFERQHWAKIRLQAEIVDVGVGQTGLTVNGVLMRLSDSMFLQGGGTWGASPANLAMTEPDATNFPGFYTYTVPASSINLSDAEEMAQGYLLKITETTLPVLEHVKIIPDVSAGESVKMLALRQENMKFLPTAWDATTGQPTAGTIWVYQSAALAAADSVPDGTGALAEYTITATFNGSGQLTGYTSVLA